MNTNRKFYDEAFAEIFSHPKIIQSLLEDFIAEPWVKRIDFSSMEVSKSVFKGLRDNKRESDLLLKFETKELQSKTFYLYILLEFQSQPQPMILRLLEYLLRIYRKQKKEPGQLSPVIPMVIYNGKKPWREDSEFRKQFHRLSDDILPYIPCFQYILIDIARMDETLLLNFKDSVSWFFLLDKTDLKNREKAGRKIVEILRTIRRSEPDLFNLLGSYITELLQYRGVEISHLNEYINEERGETMLAESLDELIEESKESGRLEGREEGLLKGREEERTLQEELRKKELFESKRISAQKMLKAGMDQKMICHILDLNAEDIQNLSV